MSDNNILISVLFPVYRPIMDELKIALESVINQTYENWELLVLYEPSAGYDEAEYMDYIRGLHDHRIKHIILPEGFGLPKSLNRGIELAKGTYMARMDADDISYPERFQVQLDYMESHPEIDVLTSSVINIYTRKWIFRNMFHSCEVRKIMLLFENIGIAHPTAFFRAVFFDENRIRYNEEIKGSEDYHLWVDVTKAGGNIDTIDKPPLLEYRVVEGEKNHHAASRYLDQMRGWNNQAKIKMLNHVGLFSEEEQQVLMDWHMNFSSKDVPIASRLFVDLIKKNKFYDQEILRRELFFQWIYKGLLLLKHSKNNIMLKRKYVKLLFRWKYIGYTLIRLLEMKIGHCIV